MMNNQQPKIVYVKAPPQKYSGLCIAGFIMSFIPFLFLFSLCFCAIGIAECNKNNYRGGGLGIAGLTISILEICWILLMIM